MKSKIIAILILFMSVFLAAYLVYASDYVADSYVGALARVEVLNPENYRNENAEDLITRYISMGYYANSIIDHSSEAIYRIYNALLIACVAIILLSAALMIFIFKNANKSRQ